MDYEEMENAIKESLKKVETLENKCRRFHERYESQTKQIHMLAKRITKLEEEKKEIGVNWRNENEQR